MMVKVPAVLLVVLALAAAGCGTKKPASRPQPDAQPEPDAAAFPDRPPDTAREDGTAPDTAGDGPADGGADVAAPGGDGPAADAAPGDVATGEGGMIGPLALTSVAPGSAARGASLNLDVVGTGFAAGAVVVFGGFSLVTTRMSDTLLRAQVTAMRTNLAGQHAVWIENRTMPNVAVPASQRSNTIYFLITAPPGAPEVVDYSPDNAVVGGTAKIVGFNLSFETVRIVDQGGRMATVGAVGTLPRTNVILETVEFTVPAGFQTGPLTISNSLGMFRGKVFNVGRNLALGPTVQRTASSEYGGEWTITRGADNDLATSWFAAQGNCATAPPPMCMMPPWYMVTFPAPETVNRISMRGNREYANGYDFLRGKFEILGAGGAVLWMQSLDLPEPDRDLDVVIPMPVANATAVRFTSERDESVDPGFADLQVFGP